MELIRVLQNLVMEIAKRIFILAVKENAKRTYHIFGAMKFAKVCFCHVMAFVITHILENVQKEIIAFLAMQTSVAIQI